MLVYNFLNMPPLNNFTTKAKEVIRRAHELALERGQNHVNPSHLLLALIMQEESMVSSILEKFEADVILLTDSLLDVIDGVAPSANIRSEERRVGKECRL